MIGVSSTSSTANQKNNHDLAKPDTYVVSTKSPTWTKEYSKQQAIVVAQRYGLPVKLFIELVRQESGFNTKALSKAGAYGLAQLMPATARGLKVDRTDPRQNLEGGARYLSKQYRKFGRWDFALAAYNAGPNAVEKYNGIPPYKETQNYVSVILKRSGFASGYSDKKPNQSNPKFVRVIRAEASSGNKNQSETIQPSWAVFEHTNHNSLIVFSK